MLRDSYKEYIQRALMGSGVTRLVGSLLPSCVVLLRYHSVQEEPERFAHSIGRGIIHSLSAFEAQMQLVAGRFNPVTLDDVLLFVAGKKVLPRRPVAVTFDDGYADNYE